ncbi:MAG: Rv1355c family protein [Myxococcota bacterium]
MTKLAERLATFDSPADETSAWRPRLFRLSDPQDAAQLEALVDSGRVRSVHDTIVAQLEDLARIRNPWLKKGPRIVELGRELLGGVPAAEYGNWVYYAWSGCLVHVMPADEFRELRADRNRNKITRTEQDRLESLHVGVVGLSVGQATALTLAMEGVGGTFRIADFDHLDLSNLNRLRAGVHEIGVPKVYITAREIFEINPYAKVEIYPEGINGDNVDAFLTQPVPLDFVAEECDDLLVKLLLRERARAHRVPVIMETSDRGMVDIERFDLEPDRPLLHGLVGDVKAEDLRGLSTFDKVPIVLRLIGAQTISKRLAASMLDVESSLASWPQLASSVALGGAAVTDVARRMCLGQLQTSGRYYVDLDEIIHDGAQSREQAGLSYDIEQTEVLPEVAPALAPAEGAQLDDAQVRALVAHGLLAPSGGNCQPWRFVYSEGTLRCIHDVERSRSLLDYAHTASYLSFGAVVENIELAAAGMGLEVSLELFPRPEDPTEVCWLRFAPAKGLEVSDLAALVDKRTTNRRRDGRRPLPDGAAKALMQSAADVGGRLQLRTEDADLDALGIILGRGEKVRLLSATMHREMMDEIRWSARETEQTRDGVDVATLEMNRADFAGLRLISNWPLMEVVEKLEGGTGLLRPSIKAVEAASAVGLVTVPGTTPADYFAAGRAMQRVWLTATKLGIAFQPMSALAYLFARVLRGGGEGLRPSEVEELQRLHQDFGEVFECVDGHAYGMIFRLAVVDAPPTVRSLRRELDDVLTITR